MGSGPPTGRQLSASDAARLRAKWRRSLRAIRLDIGQQLLDYETFTELGEIVNANPAIRRPADIHLWLLRNYAVAAAIGIRRFDDRDSRSRSLWRLLDEARRNPGVLTRRAHRSLYRRSPDMADQTFDNIAGRKATCVERALIERDLRRLERACARIRKFANKRVAHVAPRGAIRHIPTYGDFETALSEIEDIARTYTVLLTGVWDHSFKPERQYDWRTVFDRPWRKKSGNR